MNIWYGQLPYGTFRVGFKEMAQVGASVCFFLLILIFISISAILILATLMFNASSIDGVRAPLSCAV